MAVHKHLKNAPVKEALIDIQFQPSVPVETVEAFAKRISAAYPTQSKIWQAYVDLSHDESGATVSGTNQSQLGVRSDTADGRFVVQARVNGFTVSRLNPYGRWEDLLTEAARWWQVFSEEATPRVITRLAVRYINSICVPLPVDDFSDYLTCHPQIPPELTQGLTSFLYRVEIPDEKTSALSVVTQALDPLQAGADGSVSLPIVLDIDVFKTVSLINPSADEIATQLSELRTIKNRIFFAYITEKTAEMYS